MKLMDYKNRGKGIPVSEIKEITQGEEDDLARHHW
jgi:hypothetical protein